MTRPEVAAIRVDAARRLEELRAARAVLVPDSDDRAVMSELTMIQSAIAAAENAVAA